MTRLFLLVVFLPLFSCQVPVPQDEKTNPPLDTIAQRFKNSKLTLQDLLSLRKDLVDLSTFDKLTKDPLDTLLTRDTLLVHFLPDNTSRHDTTTYVDASPLIDEIKAKALAKGFKTVLKYMPVYDYKNNHSNTVGLLPDNATHYF